MLNRLYHEKDMIDKTMFSEYKKLDDYSQSRMLRLQTLIRLRWLAVAGQTITILFVSQILGFPLPILFCLALVTVSVALNVFLARRHPSTRRLSSKSAMLVLGFDVLQLSSLLFMTGGLANPFSVLICVPVIISSASLPVRRTLLLGLVTFMCVTFLGFYSLPLPWYPDFVLDIPSVYLIGVWIAIISTTAFAAFYAHRVSAEANELANALTATELALLREQHLSAIDGLAAAAAHELGTPLATISVVAKEMQRALRDDDPMREDVQLLTSQSERCRDILRRLTTLSAEDEEHMRRLPFSSLIEEVVAPHREFGIAIESHITTDTLQEPIGRRNAGILFSLGNLMENAVDFANTKVELKAHYDADFVEIIIIDDGPGYSQNIIQQIGEPYMKHRTGSEVDKAGGLGLGLFIAKTLLERSGAILSFSNNAYPATGAVVSVKWPRIALDVFKV
jgi:two-component system sensor histidine kinase RegB